MQFSNIRYASCPCCSSADIHFCFSAKDHVATGEAFEIWECVACTVRFTQNIPPMEAIGRYYDSDEYLSHSTSNASWFNRVYLLARHYSVWWRYRTIRHWMQVAGNRLLDIGTGAGQFAFFMKKQGWQVMAVEADEDARKEATQRYDFTVQSPEALNEVNSDSFDAITLWHVLEHVHPLHEYLQTAFRLLGDAGRLFIAVPNYTAPEARHYAAYWYAYDVPRHLYHFSPASLIALLSQHGFQLIGHKAFWLDPFYACLQSEKLLGKKAWPITGTWQGLKSCLAGFFRTNKASAITYVFRKTSPFSNP